MPISQFNVTIEKNDAAEGRRACGEFVRWVRSTLHALMHDDSYAPLFDPGLRARAAEAWEQADGDFRALLQDLEMHKNMDDFTERGLSGAQLEFKLAVVRWRFEGWKQGFVSLRSLLMTADDLLKSILDLVGRGGCLDEYKRFVENSLRA